MTLCFLQMLEYMTCFLVEDNNSVVAVLKLITNNYSSFWTMTNLTSFRLEDET